MMIVRTPMMMLILGSAERLLRTWFPAEEVSKALCERESWEGYIPIA
jgi:hypothetical protein